MTMVYEGGQKCWNGPERSLKVHFRGECGLVYVRCTTCGVDSICVVTVSLGSTCQSLAGKPKLWHGQRSPLYRRAIYVCVRHDLQDASRSAACHIQIHCVGANH